MSGSSNEFLRKGFVKAHLEIPGTMPCSRDEFILKLSDWGEWKRAFARYNDEKRDLHGSKFSASNYIKPLLLQHLNI